VAGDFIIARVSGRPTLTNAYPVTDERGRVIAVVFAGLDLEWLDKFFSEVDLPEGSTILVSDYKGMILTRYPDPEKWRGQFLSASSLRTLLSKSEGVTEEVGVDGVPRLYGFTKLCCLPQGNVYVRVGIPKAITLAEVRRILLRNLSMFGVVIMLCYAIASGSADLLILRQLRVMLNVIRHYETGDFSARVELASRNGELGQIAHALDQMAATIESREIERNRYEDTLRQEQLARAALLEKMISTQEEERKRIARELHDQTSQDLAALKLSLDACVLGLSVDKQRSEQHLQTALSITGSILANIRDLINDLRPSLLDDLGLASAISWYGEQRLKPKEIVLEFSCNRMDARLSPSLEIALFRTIQEALTNIIKHADATKVKVTLDMSDLNLLLKVEDNGKGFEIQKHSHRQKRWARPRDTRHAGTGDRRGR